MAEYRTADLGQAMQTAEALKGMKRQAETDKLRDAYLGVRTQNEQAAGKQSQETHDAEMGAFKARYKYLLADNAEKDPDPVGFIKRMAPELISDFDAHYGAGSFEQLTPEQRMGLLRQIKGKAAADAGLMPAQPKERPLITTVGRNGKPVRGEDVPGVEVYQEPKNEKPVARFRPMNQQEIQATGLPPGTAAQVNDTTGQIQVLSKRDASSTLSQKDATVAKQKLVTLQLARQQLNAIRERFGGIKGTVSAGAFGQGMLPSESGKSFDAAVDQMRSTLTALTRTPGVGAMSDYETKLDQAKFPSRQNYEAVTQQQIDAIEDQLSLLENGYQSLLGGSQPTEQPQEPDLSQVSDDDLLRALAGG